jgi:colanic acid/amylovoran biosynthesis glycosyltransferase
MLKVTFCTYDKPDSVGGPGAWLTRLLPALSAKGIQVRCLVLVHCGEIGPTATALMRQGIECAVVESPQYLEDQVAWILAKLQEEPPDVFVPNLVLAGLFAARWLKAANIPSVAVIHSDDKYYHGVINDFVLGDQGSRLSSVVCVSKELERQVVAKLPDEVLVRTIPCGVPIPGATVKRLPGRLRLAYVGRLVEEQKRISELTRAFCAVANQIDGVDAAIAGDGPDRISVEAILANECHGFNVNLVGRLDVDTVQDFLLSHDVIVLLSDYEGLPIALMEGMACGCVPVALRIASGVPELIVDGETGLMVGDRESSFIEAIRRLRDDVGLWERLSVAAKARITESYSEESSTAKWEQLLWELAAVSSPPKALQIPKKISIAGGHPALELKQRVKPRVSLALLMYRHLRMEAGRLRSAMSSFNLRGRS